MTRSFESGTNYNVQAVLLIILDCLILSQTVSDSYQMLHLETHHKPILNLLYHLNSHLINLTIDLKPILLIFVNHSHGSIKLSKTFWEPIRRLLEPVAMLL